VVEGVQRMKDSGPLAKWETQDGYLTYFLYAADQGYVLHKRDLNARISTTENPVKQFSLEAAIKSVESKIKPAEKQLARVY
jgi:hypothetical protein